MISQLLNSQVCTLFHVPLPMNTENNVARIKLLTTNGELLKQDSGGITYYVTIKNIDKILKLNVFLVDNIPSKICFLNVFIHRKVQIFLFVQN